MRERRYLNWSCRGLTDRKPVVYLDRDGTILNERGYLRDSNKLNFYPSAFKGLKFLSDRGCLLVVITNQSGVARGYVSLERLNKIHKEFKKKLKKHGVTIHGIYFCPHSPDAGCSCRKPKPGLIHRARKDLPVDERLEFVVGDQKTDMGLAQAIKARGILVLTGAGRQTKNSLNLSDVRVTRNLSSAGKIIVEMLAERPRRI